jgi:flavin-dependent dehydrogenase
MDYDVIIAGGGPAGATCATILAQHGRRVLLLEKERFPRFKIGESLMPFTYGPFKRIGVLDKLKQSRFVRKHSVQFVNASGKESQPFYFQQTHPHESSTTWQVLRSEFDQMMLENAREKGVDAREGWAVQDVLFDGGRAVGVKAKDPDGVVHDVRAAVTVDATGTSAILRPDPKLRKAAVFAHYRGAKRDTGMDEGATLVLHLANGRGWFWFIPLPDDIASIGVVADSEYLFDGRKGDPQRVLREEIARCPKIEERLAEATPTSDAHVLSDFSYSARRCAGDGWVLIGDAFGFLDPIYSSGVFLALVSGERAADAIHEALEAGDPSAARLGAWGGEFYAGMQAIRKLVYAFYTDGFSFGRFMRENPDQLRNLVGVLIGDVYTPQTLEVFESMSRMADLPEPQELEPPDARSA